MANNKVQKRKYVIGLLVLLAMATMSTYAWTVDTATSDPSKVIVSQTSYKTASVSSYSSRPIGKNKILITFTLTGNSTDCTLAFLTSSGSIQTVSHTVKNGETTLTADTTYKDYAMTVAAGTVTITVEGTNCYKDLDTGTGGDQTFSGIMLTFK